MVDSQEIVERSFYSALLEVMVKLGYTLDPKDYLPVTDQTIEQFKLDRKEIENNKGFYIELYGPGSPFEKGLKFVPRIVIVPGGFFPGDIGFERYAFQQEESKISIVSESPYEAFSQYIDIHLVSKDSKQARLLGQILNTALPQRGYIKPYYEPEPLQAGNMFIQVTNFFDQSSSETGMLEKVYQFEVHDTLLRPGTVVDNIVPMTDVTMIIENMDSEPDNNKVIIHEISTQE